MIQSARFRAAMAALRGAGISELIVSPGSRSTPLIAAAIAEGLRCRAVVDERSAAHVALGQARVTDRPSAVLCTSGSAAANYMPAVVEASTANLPLVIFSADRPAELQACGAPQSMDQTRLYGAFARLYTDLGDPAAGHTSAINAVARKVRQAVSTAMGTRPGPVHINAPARKPLEPRELDAELEITLAAIRARPAVLPPNTIARNDDLEQVAAMCADAEKGVISCGPLGLYAIAWREAIAELSERTGFPVLAEACSQQRLWSGSIGVANFDLLYQTERWRRSAVPELIVQIGPPPISASFSAMLAATPIRRVVLAQAGWPDPYNNAERVVVCDLGDALPRLVARLEPRKNGPWRQRFEAADAIANNVVREERRGEDGPTSEGAAVHAAVTALPSGALLCLGNSLPIRLIDTYCTPAEANIDVVSQRGVSGIDGVISAAAGAAIAAKRPTCLILGDVSFGHDMTGLLVATTVRTPLVIVVIDNQGGHIFDRLPVASSDALASRYEELWRTPPAFAICAAAKALGAHARHALGAEDIAANVAAAAARAGCTVIHARVDPTSAERSRQRLVKRLGTALAGSTAP